MKTKNLLKLLLATATALSPLLAEARTPLSMSERESVQSIVWIMEATTFVTVIVIIGLIWRVIKRDRAKQRSGQDSKQE